MEPYLIQGIVLPERAQLSLQFKVQFSHSLSKAEGIVTVSIILNKVAVWIDGIHEWDIFDLRNMVRKIIQTHLAIIGYLNGCAYDIEITRILHRESDIDYVYGIDIPCISSRHNPNELQDNIAPILRIVSGAWGYLLQRCFNDLTSAMKNPEDTGFFIAIAQ
jgi:hypothetical protein